MRGAEAIIIKSEFNEKPCLIKQRIEKKYRIKELDLSLRKRRTRRESKLLIYAANGGIECPRVFEVGVFTIKMSILDGKKPKENEKNLMLAGRLLSKLHKLNIIHGDYTFDNLLLDEMGKLKVIDFGLGSFSHKIEHKAMDVFTMLLSIKDKQLSSFFLDSYLSKCEDSDKIRIRLDNISKRVRYS